MSISAQTFSLWNAVLHATYSTHAARLCQYLSVAVSWAWRAIWSPLPCHVPCEVLSAWPLRSPGGDWRLAAQHFQPRQLTSEKEIWVDQMEGLLPSYLQHSALVQCHPRYSIWELVCVVPAVMCVRELGGKGGCSCECTFTRKCKLWMCACRHLCFRTYKLTKNKSLQSETEKWP